MELSRGWVTLSGILNGSFIAGYDDPHARHRGAEAGATCRASRRARSAPSFSMTEPHAGSDVQAIRTMAVRDGDEYVIYGQKMWVTNGWRSGMIMLLAKTDPTADPPHTGMTGFIVEKEPEISNPPGLTIPMPRLEEARLQGRRVDRARLRRLPHARRERPRRRGRHRPGLQVLHERDRGRARERRRPRRRARPGRRSTTRSATRRSARRSASRSATTRPSS